jgi:hypothetical protein
VEQELAAGLSEEQVTKFIENDEVNARQVIGGTAIPAVTGLCFRSVDEEARPALTRCGSMAPTSGKASSQARTSVRSTFQSRQGNGCAMSARLEGDHTENPLIANGGSQ